MATIKKQTVIASALAITLLGACSTTNNTQKGAGIGAVIGAVAGKATGDNDKSRYVWGAALGAIAGSAIGSYMDRQEQELREQLADTGVDVIRENDNLRLVIPSKLTFDTNSASVSSSFYPILDDVAVVLRQYDKTKLKIEGHTDSVGSEQYNKQLSMSRANNVAAYLASQDIKDVRLKTLGLGETQPIASNDEAKNREKNRRVELEIIPIEQS